MSEEGEKVPESEALKPNELKSEDEGKPEDYNNSRAWRSVSGKAVRLRFGWTGPRLITQRHIDMLEQMDKKEGASRPTDTPFEKKSPSSGS